MQPGEEPRLPTGPLNLQEAVQSPERAGYLPGLTHYLQHPVEGKAYHVFVDVGKRFPDSRPLFDEPRPPVYVPAEESEPTRLAIPADYRPEFDELVQTLLATSRVQQVLVLCEWNGNVTWSNPGRQLLKRMLREVKVYGPDPLQEFWIREEAGLIIEPSISIIHAL